jgi:aminopeptidase N
MKKLTSKLTFAGFVILAACNTTKKTNDTAIAPPPPPPLEEITLEDLNVTAPAGGAKISDDQTIPLYQATAERTNDLLHTKLDLKFDWAKQRVMGKAILSFKPYFYATDKLVLDAQNFDFNSITIEGKNTPLKYDYNNEQVTITLDRVYNRNEEYKIAIDYVAKPEERINKGGSAAINSDKGLYFINPKGEDSEKPMQIWSQGETQSNSCWFPTIDRPNERATNEVTLTVEDKYKTLSNGLLTASKKNNDGTRTDTWTMDMPHAPYLIMIAVGEYAVVKDKWENKELSYYVEKPFESDAKAIFPNTPEMLTFFSNKLGVKYPWQKYAQIITRDYVSGAMENTTAVIFGEFMQNHARDLIDNEANESVVAHELFHHWFGDYVTTESWSNLTLNEGFANYSEYLWLEYKYGKDAADAHWLEQYQGYLGEAASKRHDLIDFEYSSREDMFDAHSYNKGGMVLHMLRNQIGDDAFFTALSDYLKTYAFQAVEGHNLRMAFEKTSGRDLNRFFNQWYYTSGHPEVTASKEYDAVTGKLSVTLAQTQDGEKNAPVYQLPIAIDVYTAAGEKQRFDVVTTKRKETFIFDIKKEPKFVNIDADRVTLWNLEYPKKKEEYAFQFLNGKHYLDRREALEGLGNTEPESAEAKLVFEAGLKDNHYSIRAAAVNMVDIAKPEVAALVEKMALTDAHSAVRGSAMFRLAQTEDKKYVAIAKQILDKEQAYPVISEALQGLYLLDRTEALTYVKKLEKEENSSIISGIAAIYAENPKAENLDFFEKNLTKINGFDAINFAGAYAKIAVGLDEASQTRGIEKLKTVALNQTTSPWQRYGAAKGLADMKAAYKQMNNTGQMQLLNKLLNEIKEKETNKQLKTVYENLEK